MASVPDGDTAQGTGAPTFPSSLPPSVSPAQALASTLESQLIQPTLFSYVANDLVWARASARATDPFWPGRMIDANEAPEGVRRECVSNAVCVQFYGPSASKSRDRDFCWARENQLAPFGENFLRLTNQNVPKRLRPVAFKLAVEECEGLFREHGRNVSVLFAEAEGVVEGVAGGGDDATNLDLQNQGTATDSDDSDKICCTSCALPLEQALLKNAPPGVKGTGRCRLCSKLHKEKQHCPVCDKVWQWANCPAMVGCDSCDFWVHAACDHKAQCVMDAPEDGPEVMYYCPVCVEKTSKEQAKENAKQAKEDEKVLAKEKLKLAKTEKAREERAEKAAAQKAENDATKQQQREEEPHVKFEGFDNVPELDFGGRGLNHVFRDDGDEDVPTGGAKTHAQQPPSNSRKINLSKAPKLITHKKAPGGVPRRPKSAWQIFGSDFFKQYRDAHKDDVGGVNFAEVYKFQGQAWRDLPDDERVLYEARAKIEAEKFRAMIASLQESGQMPVDKTKKGGKGSGKGAQGGGGGTGGGSKPTHGGDDNDSEAQCHRAIDMGGGVVKKDGVLCGPDGAALSKLAAKAFESGYQPRVDRRASHWSQHFRADEILKRPDKVGVTCNGVLADFHIKEFRMSCRCSQCRGGGKLLSATEFEKHAGMGQAKKWKASIRMVEPARMPIGRWLDGGDAPSGKGSGDAKGGGKKKGVSGKVSENTSLNKKNLGYKLVRVKWSVDRCAVCDDDRDFDFDQLVTCEGCGISVHQSCYGIPEIPDDAVGYLCAACEHTGGVVSETPLCVLCPVEGGALKPTTEKNKWCHSACCQWIPETTVLDVDRMEPIDQIKTIQRERWELLCTVCKQRVGAKIQCASPGCYLAYHPLCARAAGLFMEQSLGDEDEDNPADDSPLVMVSYCHRHCRVDTERAAEWVVDEETAVAAKNAGNAAGGTQGESLPDRKKLSKQEQNLFNEALAKKTAEDLVAKRERDDALDLPEDVYGAARCRPFDKSKLQGHPRTEAGEEVIVADKTTRRALQHGLGNGSRENRLGGKKRREREAWVQCETCAKWRRVPQSVAEAFSQCDAGQWVCSLSEHPRVNSCLVDQELPDDDIDDRVALGDKCPFYDDDDLDPPEVDFDLDEEKDEEEEEEEEEDEDEDDDEDDDDSESLSDALVDAPPGGWGGAADGGGFGFLPGNELMRVDAMETRDQLTVVGAPTGGVVLSPDAKRLRGGDENLEGEDEKSSPSRKSDDALFAPTEGTLTGEQSRELISDDDAAPKKRARAETVADEEDDIAETAAKKRRDGGPGGPVPGGGDALMGAVSADVDARALPADTTDDATRLVETNYAACDSALEATDPAGIEPGPPDPAGTQLPTQPVHIHSKEKRAPLSTLPDVRVLCKNLAGVFRPRDNLIACVCARCDKQNTLWEPNRWEVHCGMRQAKKWKTSIRVVDPVDQPSDEERARFKETTATRKAAARADALNGTTTREPDDDPDDPDELPVEIETFLGEWLERNGLVVEVVPATRKSSGKNTKDGADDAQKPKPAKPKKDGAEKRKRSGRAALAGLAIDLDLDHGMRDESARIERSAQGLIGRHLQINPNAGPGGAQLVLGGAANKPPKAIVQAIAQHTPNTGLTRFVRKSKKWLNGVVTDMKMSRGGCRHFVRCASGETEDSHGAGSADWFTLNRVEIRWSLEEGPEPDLSFLPSSAPMQSTRRGMGGMAAMFAKSLAAPAPLGTWRAANISSTDSKEKEDDDDEEDEEDERAIFLAVQKADAEAKALRDSDGGGENVRGGGGAAMDADAEEDATVLPNAADTDPPPEHGLVGVLPDDLPDVVTVICKQTAGDYYPRTGLIKCLCDACQEGLGFGEDLDDEADETGVKKEKEHAAGEEESTHEKMDPNRWEMHCGMGQAKKWKASVRVVLANHRTMPVGKWLTGFGVAVSARLPRREVKYGPKRSKLNKLKKKGLYDSEDELYRRLEPMGKGGKGSVKKGPPPRSGKRTFVELIPYVVRGAKLRSKGGNNKGGFARVGFSGDVDGEGVAFLSEKEKTNSTDPAVAEGASLAITSQIFTPEQWEADRSRRLASHTTGVVAVAAMEHAAKMIDEGKGVKERILDAQRLLKDRATFGKSNIHGWGLIAKQPIKAGTMVIPFRGEKLRPSVANLREKAYEASGKDCYLLMADPKTVIDTTRKGNVARFTNHSCAPNMYTKIVTADNQSHIIFFTRSDVSPGEELTYNYRFDAESGKVPCFCGAHNCRGFLC